MCESEFEVVLQGISVCTFYNFPFRRYLNQQHIKKQMPSEAERIFGNYAGDPQEQMEIGELGKLYIYID